MQSPIPHGTVPGITGICHLGRLREVTASLLDHRGQHLGQLGVAEGTGMEMEWFSSQCGTTYWLLTLACSHCVTVNVNTTEVNSYVTVTLLLPWQQTIPVIHYRITLMCQHNQYINIISPV